MLDDDDEKICGLLYAVRCLLAQIGNKLRATPRDTEADEIRARRRMALCNELRIMGRRTKEIAAEIQE